MVAMPWICPCGKGNGDDRQSCRSCGRPLFQHAPAPQPVHYAYPPPPQNWQAPRCKTCDQGTLIQRKSFRMSGPVVFIGFILLIPSILGMIFSALLFFRIIGTSESEVLRTRNEAVARMHNGHFSEELISAIADERDADVNSWLLQNERLLRSEQIAWIRDAQRKTRADLAASRVGVVFGSGLIIAMGIASLVGGLLGWLLVMRKRVLQCSLCGAVVNAS